MKFLAAPLMIALSLLAGSAHGADALQGNIKIDGSSTVFPISEAVAEEFQKANPKVRVTVGVSGTGGGFKKFVAGETDINDSSRGIKPDEMAKATENKIEFIEIMIGYDGLSVVVNPKNTWAKSITMDQLKKLWEPNSKVATWKDLDPSWPDKKIKLYGPGTDSGTFDYFTEEVVGKAKSSRADYTASEDDNALVTGIAGDENALGYFGFAYYQENKTKIKDLPVVGKKGGEAVPPNDTTIENGTYPLSRPLFLDIAKKSTTRPEVEAFMQFYLKNAKDLVKQVGYTPLPAKLYEEATKRYNERKTGPWMASASH